MEQEQEDEAYVEGATQEEAEDKVDKEGGLEQEE